MTYLHSILPLANQAAAQLKDKNGVVIGVNTDIETEAKKALADYQVGFHNVLDNTSSGPNTTLYNLRNFLTLHLIDPIGLIVIKNEALNVLGAQVLAKK